LKVHRALRSNTTMGDYSNILQTEKQEKKKVQVYS
jgi:hypothetical protein